jgi:plasmid maintenance system antidote protein VapI
MTKRTKLTPVSPGEMLLEEFLKPMELSELKGSGTIYYTIRSTC